MTAPAVNALKQKKKQREHDENDLAKNISTVT